MRKLAIIFLLLITIMIAACVSRSQAGQRVPPKVTPTPAIPPAQYHGPRPDCTDPATAAACRGMLEGGRR